MRIWLFIQLSTSNRGRTIKLETTSRFHQNFEVPLNLADFYPLLDLDKQFSQRLIVFEIPPLKVEGNLI